MMCLDQSSVTGQNPLILIKLKAIALRFLVKMGGFLSKWTIFEANFESP